VHLSAQDLLCTECWVHSRPRAQRLSAECASASCVVLMSTSKQQSENKHKNNTHCGSALKPGASGLPYYCASICVRSWCDWRATSVDSKPTKKKKDCEMSRGSSPPSGWCSKTSDTADDKSLKRSEFQICVHFYCGIIRVSYCSWCGFPRQIFNYWNENGN